MRSQIDRQIVLATYNGERFLEQQLESILSQMGDRDELLVHDDGSTDGTRELLRRIAGQESMVRLLVHPPAGGPKENFAFLLGQTSARYVYCADQDDVWMPGKLDRFEQVIQFYESVYGEDTPLLVHSDLSLIDEAGSPISDSLWYYQAIDPRWGDHFNLIMTQNAVTGCAMMVNRALLKIALPIPCQAVMHDWWLAMVACAFGKVVWLPEVTVLYRQHRDNNVGAKRFVINPVKQFQYREQIRTSLLESTAQAGAFAQRYVDSPWVELARIYSELPSLSYPSRRYSLVRHKFFKSTLLKNLAWVIFV
ncbi:glycosyltransferase family 2 protein [Deinococcus planocerae]|uniref:glycosyltransferase family 2 protein n=1 Tax=Deinococcus planocerae TaxID=1737569 RepID=UPI000C7E88A7|nr:glycosyltransferase family 2 protein [Deinococcus planocerae]